MYNIKMKEELSQKDISEWNSLWEKSKYRRLYNSYYWYLFCKKNLNGNYKVLFIYKNKKLVAILPFKVVFNIIYISPGDRFIDKNSNLFLEEDNLVVSYITKKVFRNKIIIFKEVPESELLFYCNDGYTKTSSINPYAFINKDLSSISKRTRKKLDSIIKEESNNFSLAVFKNYEIKNNINIVFDIESKSNKIKKNRNIFNKNNIRNLFKDLSLYPGSRLFILKYKGKPIAHTYDFINNNYLLGCHTAYLEEFKRFLPGKLLTYYVMKYCLDNKIEKYDFSRGDCDKKRQFAIESENNYHIIYGNKIIILFIKIYDDIIYFLKRIKRILRKYKIIK